MPVADRASAACSYLLRLSLATDHAESRNPYPVTLKFWHSSVLDVLNPTGEALWGSDRDGEWQLRAAAGAEFGLPKGYREWREVNQEAVRQRRVLELDAGGATHFVVARERRTGAHQVLHVVAKPEGSASDAACFLELAVRLLALQDGTWWEGRGRPRPRPSELSPRQSAILELMREGATYRRIGSQLGFSESTVKQEAMRIFDVLGVRDRASAVAQAGGWTAQPTRRLVDSKVHKPI